MLELVDLARSYGDVVALDGLSFTLEPGEMLGFVGPNGSGKTTTMRIVMGLFEADKGTVHWKGQSVTEETRTRFGYMPEERGLYPKMKVTDQLSYLGRLSGLDALEAKNATSSLVDQLGVKDRAHERVEALSLGNQQRVQLAAALIGNPEVLILDEPFSGLDPVGVDVLSEVLRAQNDRGVPVMFSSHQLELVERLCDSVVIINRGRLVAKGKVGELRSTHDRRVLKVEVEGAALSWAVNLAGVEVVDQRDKTLTLALEDATDEQVVLDAARQAGRVRHFEIVKPHLSEIFREVITR
jgi:ABC-2 type transport system ATP-binding protein